MQGAVQSKGILCGSWWGSQDPKCEWIGPEVLWHLAGRGALLAAALTSQEGPGAGALDMKKGRLVVQCSGDPSRANRVFLTLLWSCTVIVTTAY